MTRLGTKLDHDILVAIEEVASTYRPFLDFCREDMFGQDGIIDKRDLGRCHDEMCNIMGSPNDTGEQRTRLHLWPRGHLKSTICTVAYSVWCVIHNPNVRILIISETEKLSKKMLDSIRSVFENERFVEKYGEHVGKTWTGKSLTVKTRTHKTLREPTISVASVETSEVGGHYEKIICDDIHSEKNVTSREMIDKVKKLFSILYPILEPGGDIDVIGTRWDTDDLYADLIERLPKHNITLRRAFDDGGNILYPEKFTKEFFQDSRRNLGTYMFNLLYQNEPTSPEDQVFKAEWLQRCMYTDSRWPDNLRYYIAVDPAISENRYADFTAMVVAGVDDRDVWHIVETVNERITPDVIITRLFDLVRRWKPLGVGVEVVSYQKMLKNWIERTMMDRKCYFNIVELKPGDRSKAKRIEALMPRVEYTAIRWRPSCDLLTDQFRRFRVDREQSHDDLVDAVAYLADMVPPIVGKPDHVIRGPEVESKFRFGESFAPGASRGWYGKDFSHYRRVG
jgi:hypothetical protein